MGFPLFHTAKNFVPGGIARYVREWEKVSGDPWVRETVKGVKIPLTQTPVQVREPFPFRLSEVEKNILREELKKLEVKGVIEKAQPEIGQFISNVFLRPKPNGEFRLILDLTELNKFVVYEHFKMTSLQTALDMLRGQAWMGSVDLKDAYYSVGIDVADRKFVRFYWEGQLYQFVGMPNGLACAPRLFTKLLKPVFAALREEGHECFPYIDDSFVVADSWEQCQASLRALCNMLDQLGLVVHQDKSVLTPTQDLTFLGFEIDSVGLKVRPTIEKREKFLRAAEDALGKTRLSIREVAGLVGLMIAYQVGVQYGGAHIKALEKDKIKALAKKKGNFDAMMAISKEGKEDIEWWVSEIGSAEKMIRLESPEVEICTDASTQGWGAHRGTTTSGGRWTQVEQESHINVLELRAILFGLQSLCSEQDEFIRILTDNTTALAYVKHMGGVRSDECNEVAKEIWDWLEQRNLWVVIAHIPGSENDIADYKSRNFQDNLEWEVKQKNFQKICRVFGTPDVDLFASRLNRKVETYVAWNPEPGAWRIDAFSFKWSNAFYFVFPPFSLVGRVVQKLVADGTKAVVVAPNWPAQPWFARLMSVAKRKLTFRKRKGNLQNQGNPDNYDFVNSCPLVACLLWDANY